MSRSFELDAIAKNTHPIMIVNHLTCVLCRILHGCLSSSSSVRTSRTFEFAAMPHETPDRSSRLRKKPQRYGVAADGAQQEVKKKKKRDTANPVDDHQ